MKIWSSLFPSCSCTLYVWPAFEHPYASNKQIDWPQSRLEDLENSYGRADVRCKSWNDSLMTSYVAHIFEMAWTNRN